MEWETIKGYFDEIIEFFKGFFDKLQEFINAFSPDWSVRP